MPDQAKKRGYKTHYIWAEGEVVEIADGTTTKRTPQCKTVLAWGAVRIKWPKDSRYDEDESFTWTVLVEDSWRKEKHLGWRFAKPELARRGAHARQSAHGLTPRSGRCATVGSRQGVLTLRGRCQSAKFRDFVLVYL